jgi:voltage-gated potassium channel
VDKNNFFWLLLALLIFLIGVPLADDHTVLSGPSAKLFVFSCFLVIGVWSLKRFGKFFSVGIALVLAGITLNVLAVYSPLALFQYGSLAALLAFLLIVVFCTFTQVVFGTEISANRLVGAVCIYLILGVIWAVAYSILEMTFPGSFQGFVPMEDREWDSEWLYFSFVTMTTLGYGDIAPVSATVRALAYMEAVFGQLYIAILVAGLVSVHMSHRDTRKTDE